MFGCIRDSVVMMMLWTLLVIAVPVQCESNDPKMKVKGLIHETINVTLDLQNIHLDNSNLVCTSEMPYVNFLYQDDHLHSALSVRLEEGQRFVEFKLQSNLIGIFNVDCHITEATEPAGRILTRLEVVVGRVKVEENILVNLMFSVGMGSALLIMGMEIEVEKVLEVVKRPIGPVVGFCCQFLVMPLTSYGLGYLILETKYERLGLLLLGCCPGGVGSNFWTAMLGGDINLSVTMTFFSSVAAFAMTSFWIWMLGSPLVSEDLPIPYIQLTIALFSFAIPIILGMIARKYKPELCEKIRTKIGRPLWLTCVLVLVVGGVIMNLFFFYLVTWRHLLSGALLGLCGYTLGGGASLLARMTKPQIIAVAIETAIQNGGIAVVVLNLTFPSPYSDMALLPILAFFFCSAGPFLFVLFLIKRVFFKLKNYIKKDKNDILDRKGFEAVKTEA